MASDCANDQVFICFKNGGAPRDVEIATALFHALQESGVRVFFSAISVREIGNSDYSATIDNALDDASVLVVVATTLANIDSEWVKYEWGGFNNDIKDGHKPDAQIVTYTEGINPNDLPRGLRRFENFQVEKSDLTAVVDFIVKILSNQSSQSGVPPKNQEPVSKAVADDSSGALGALSRTVESKATSSKRKPSASGKRAIGSKQIMILGIAVIAAVLCIAALANGTSLQGGSDSSSTQSSSEQVQSMQAAASERAAASDQAQAKSAYAAEISGTQASQDGSVTLDTTNFDEGLCKSLTTYDTNGDGTLSASEISEITQLKCTRSTSCKGLSLLTSLVSFTGTVSGDIDLTGCSSLQALALSPYENDSFSIKFDSSWCPNLVSLSLDGGDYSDSIDVSGMDSLSSVYVNGTYSSFSASGCGKLQGVRLAGGSVTSVDLSNCASLQEADLTLCSQPITVNMTGTPDSVSVSQRDATITR